MSDLNEHEEADDELASPAWEPFVAGLRAFVARRIPSRDVDDVVQDILLRIHEQIDELRDDAKVKAWSYSVARHTVADYYRANDRHELDEEAIEQMESRDEHKGFGAFEGDHTVHEEILGWLRPAADELPEKYREALILADFEGLGQQEVADRLGLSLSGAKSRIQRARALLAAALDRCCEIALDSSGSAVDFRRQKKR